MKDDELIMKLKNYHDENYDNCELLDIWSDFEDYKNTARRFMMLKKQEDNYDPHGHKETEINKAKRNYEIQKSNFLDNLGNFLGKL